MKEKTGAHIEMNKNSPHDAPVKQFTIKGTDDQIEYAKSEIAKIVGDGKLLLFIMYLLYIVDLKIICQNNIILPLSKPT